MTANNHGKSPDQFGDMARTAEGLNLEIIQGEVFMVYPGLGVYLVLPKHGESTGTLVLCCSMGGSIGRSGTMGGDSYIGGDTVLLARQRDSVDISLDGKAFSDIGYILCAAPPDFLSTAQGFPGANIHGHTLDYFNETMTDAFANTKQLASTLRDISYGGPNDVFAGDFTKYGPLFTFFSVCATKTTIGASPMAMVEAFAFHDKVRISARSMEERSLAVECGREPDTDAMMYYRRLAMTEKEGMGAVGAAAPFVEEEDEDGAKTFEQAEEEQLGVFRHTGLAGPMGDGEIDALLRPVEEDAIHTKDNAPPAGKVSVRTTYDGRHETRASGGIDHVKSLFIPVPEQLKAHDEETSDKTDPAGPYDEDSRAWLEGSFSPYSAIEADTEFDWDTQFFRNAHIPFRADYWRIMDRKALAEAYPSLNVEKAPRQLEGLGVKQPFYDEPPHIDEEDPVTKLERRLYALESVIRQQPDGTVVIADGHGSEIRMFRGRISISPAADLELRPGRDCIELVPRRKVINAGKEVQIVSNEGKVRIKAETDLDVMAGNSGEGRMLLENRGLRGVEEDNGGIVIRTQSDLRMTGANLYAGITPPPSGGSDSGLTRERGGSVIIDSRGGSLGLQGNRLCGRFSSGVSLSSGNALMSIANGIMTCVANSTQFATGPFTIGGIKESGISQVWLDEHGISSEFVTPSGNAFLQVAGSIVGSSAIFNGVVIAQTLNATNAAFSNASRTSGLYARDVKPPEFSVDPFSVEYLSELSAGYGASVPDSLTDKVIMDAWFSYDEPKDVDQEDCTIQEMRWQAMMGAAGSTNTWEQKSVLDRDDKETYAYPGYGPDGDVLHALRDGAVAKKPLNSYIVNR